MRNEEIYKLIEKQEEILDARLRGFKAEIKSGIDIQTYKMDQLIEYQEKQNSKIRNLEKDTRVWRLIHRNPKASSIIIGLAILGIIALFILKNVIL